MGRVLKVSVLPATVICMLLVPGVAFAGGKGGGGGHASGGSKPSENVSLNYGKVEHTYSQQSASKKSGTSKSKPQQYMKYEMNNVYISR